MITFIESVAHALGIPAMLLSAVCTVESNLSPEAVNVNDGGRVSYGLCQVQLATVRQRVSRLYNPSDLFDPGVNAYVAGAILRSHYRRLGSWDKAVLAYNRGSLRLLPNGHYSNERYLWKVMKAQRQLKSQFRAHPAPMLAYSMRLSKPEKKPQEKRPTSRFAHRRPAIVPES